jgi:hypothetical protein
MNNEQAKQLQELAKQAIAIQDACNLSGVVHSFSAALTKLREVTGSGINEHPITIVWLDKLNSLAGIQDSCVNIIRAYDKVYDWADAFGVPIG